MPSRVFNWLHSLQTASVGPFMVSRRRQVIFITVILSLVVGLGGLRLEFSNDFRFWFSKSNPELLDFEAFRTAFAKSDNVFFVLEPKDGQSAFSSETLAAVETLTKEAWQLPYASRVDSITNYQNIHSIGDEIIIEHLIPDARTLSDTERDEKRRTALGDPQLVGALITADGIVTAVNVTLQFPEKSISEVPRSVNAARALRDQIEREFPHLDVHLTGIAMINNAFAEASLNDMGFLIPVMIVLIFVVTTMALGSLSATGATMVLITLSSAIGVGVAGFLGIRLTGPSVVAPIVILTLAIADSIHILTSMRIALGKGLEKRAAIAAAIHDNFLPIGITSVTTMVGFLALQTADSPPLRDFGLISAVGILAAWFLSLTLLPALLYYVKLEPVSKQSEQLMRRLMRKHSVFVRRYVWRLPLVISLVCLVLVMQIPGLELSDHWREYFAPRIEFRSESDKTIDHFGYYPVEFTVSSPAPGGINEPDYLEMLDAFSTFLSGQPDVMHVASMTDLLKRLNKSLHEDDETYFALPKAKDEASQFLLLYELSLPLGFDLTNQVNLDKSATRVTALLSGKISTKRLHTFLEDSDVWFEENGQGYGVTATGIPVLFTFLAKRNVESTVRGIALAILAIALIMMVALRSVAYGALSLIPNALPLLAVFGIWATLVGTIGLSSSVTASIALGIVVDDTVHFLSKYIRIRRERSLSAPAAIRHTFNTVGSALIINTVVLSLGIFVMTFSAFKVNSDFGLLTSLTIVLALFFDFYLLPPLLLLMDRYSRKRDLFASKDTN